MVGPEDSPQKRGNGRIFRAWKRGASFHKNHARLFPKLVKSQQVTQSAVLTDSTWPGTGSLKASQGHCFGRSRVSLSLEMYTGRD